MFIYIYYIYIIYFYVYTYIQNQFIPWQNFHLGRWREIFVYIYIYIYLMHLSICICKPVSTHTCKCSVYICRHREHVAAWCLKGFGLDSVQELKPAPLLAKCVVSFVVQFASSLLDRDWVGNLILCCHTWENVPNQPCSLYICPLDFPVYSHQSI